MIPMFFALTLALAPQQAPDLTTLVRTTLERCASGQEAVVGGTVDVADADWARPFRNDRACGVLAEGWTGAVREARVNESGRALWTQLEQAEGWAPASLRIIEPPAGQTGPVEIHFSWAG
jgi:hypothetical protein